jgi:hypothetical protein
MINETACQDMREKEEYWDIILTRSRSFMAAIERRRGEVFPGGFICDKRTPSITMSYTYPTIADRNKR